MKIKLLIGAFAAALLLSACGGDHSTDEHMTPPPVETMPEPEATPPMDEMSSEEMPAEGTPPGEPMPEEVPAEEPPAQG